MRHQVNKRDFARQLRKNQTDAEAKMWKLLRSKQLENFKFRRQHVIGPYIADFCCLFAKLVIELDGGQHAEAIQYDEARTRYLEEKGFKVLRFWDNEMLLHPEAVLEAVFGALTPTLSQLKLGEGGNTAPPSQNLPSQLKLGGGAKAANSSDKLPRPPEGGRGKG